MKWLDRLRAWCVLAVLFWLGIAQPANSMMAGMDPDSPSARIDRNTRVSPYAGVGSLVVNGRTYTASAIGRRHVLTAAHVVQGAEPGSIVFNLNFGGDLTHVIHARAVHIHPDFVSFNVPNLNDDIAVVELATPLPARLPIYHLNRTGIAAGADLIMVGYGASGNGPYGVSTASSPQVKRVGRNSADVFMPDDEGSGRDEVYVFDFDGGEARNLMGGPTLGNDVETMVAGGDSGSPSFIQSDGALLLAGVNTFATASAPDAADLERFGSVGGGQLVAAYAEWIQRIVPASSPSTGAPGDFGLGLATGAMTLALLAGAIRRRPLSDGRRR